ncbi:MAG: hypothetical protein FWC56_05450 [Phycisphaerae bacterium]|nr:hypothetical protein [Phycisphaerae bacterium]
MNSSFTIRRLILATAIMVVVGCAVAGIHGCLNPPFANTVKGGVIPLAPGNTPYVHVMFYNQTTDATFDVQYSSTATTGFKGALFTGISPQTIRGALLNCPVDYIGLGVATDLTLPAIVVHRGGDTINVPASAFPLVLRNGKDFVCGDTVIFYVMDDTTSGYGIKVVTGKVDGSTQTGPFSGPDTYQIIDALVKANAVSGNN